MEQNFPKKPQKQTTNKKKYQEPFSDHLKVGSIHRNPVTHLQINNYLQRLLASGSSSVI